MCMALYKVTMWQVKLVINSPNNSTNSSSITSILSSPPHIIWGNMATLKILSDRREAAHQKPSPSWDKENIKQGSEFPGRCSQSHIIISNNFGETPRKLVTLRWSRAWKKRLQMSDLTVKDPATRSANPVDTGKHKRSRSRGNDQETFSKNLGIPSKNVGDKKDPNDYRGSLNRMLISDTAENPVQADIQGVGIQLVFI